MINSVVKRMESWIDGLKIHVLTLVSTLNLKVGVFRVDPYSKQLHLKPLKWGCLGWTARRSTFCTKEDTGKCLPVEQKYVGNVKKFKSIIIKVIFTLHPKVPIYRVHDFKVHGAWRKECEQKASYLAV